MSHLKIKPTSTTNRYEVFNNKDTLLGYLYYYKPWKCLVWEQSIEIIMSLSCLEELTKFIKKVVLV